MGKLYLVYRIRKAKPVLATLNEETAKAYVKRWECTYYETVELE